MHPNVLKTSKEMAAWVGSWKVTFVVAVFQVWEADATCLSCGGQKLSKTPQLSMKDRVTPSECKFPRLLSARAGLLLPRYTMNLGGYKDLHQGTRRDQWYTVQTHPEDSMELRICLGDWVVGGALRQNPSSGSLKGMKNKIGSPEARTGALRGEDAW